MSPELEAALHTYANPALTVLLGFCARGWIGQLIRRLEALEKSHVALVAELRALELHTKSKIQGDLSGVSLQLAHALEQVGELKRLKPDVDALHQKIRILQGIAPARSQ